MKIEDDLIPVGSELNKANEDAGMLNSVNTYNKEMSHKISKINILLIQHQLSAAHVNIILVAKYPYTIGCLFYNQW